MDGESQRSFNVRGIEFGATDTSQERSLKLARIIFDEMYQVVGILSPDGTILECNRKALEGGGITPEEVVGKPFWETFWWTVAPETQEDLRNAIARAAQGNFIRYDVDVYARKSSREIMTMDFSLSPVKDQEGRVVFLIPEGRDITEKKSFDREIAQKNAQIQGLLDRIKELDEISPQIFANICHELQNPAAATTRTREAAEAELKWAQIVIERQIQHMARLLDDFADVSRISRGTVHLRKQRLPLRESLVSAIESVRPIIRGRSHKLTVDIPTEMIYIDADPARFAQIFSNLLTNAAKYTDPGGKIRVHAQLEAGNVVITVGDNGAGILRDQLPHVFDLFSHMSTALEPSEGRLGIGLFLVRSLVSLHGGSIEAHSNGPGKGSEFIVTLPAKGIATELCPADVPIETQTPQQNAFRVLVVDDNRDNADSCEILLHDAGFEARAAYSVSEALFVAEEFLPQAILLNVDMPGINRYEVAKRIRATDTGESAVLIAVTGWGQEDDKREAEAAGFDHHVKKPIDFANLQHLLKSSRRNG